MRCLGSFRAYRRHHSRRRTCLRPNPVEVARRQNLVVEMTRTASVSPLPSEFDGFLFAPISEDYNGMTVSVLSALARLDVDPWQEAASLARLPADTASRKLAALIAKLPAGSLAQPDTGTLASRLIALLPHQTSSIATSRGTLSGASTPAKSWPVIYVVSYMIFMAVVMHVQSGIANRQPSAPVYMAHTQASSTVSPQAPLANSVP